MSIHKTSHVRRFSFARAACVVIALGALSASCVGPDLEPPFGSRGNETPASVDEGGKAGKSGGAATTGATGSGSAGSASATSAAGSSAPPSAAGSGAVAPNTSDAGGAAGQAADQDAGVEDSP